MDDAPDWYLHPGDVSFRGVIFPWECDSMGHLSNKYYLGMFDQASWHVFLALGYRPVMAEREYVGLADVHQTIDFHHELRAGQLILVRSWLERVGAKSLTTHHEMFDAAENTAVATLESVTTFFNLRERKSISIPVSIREVAMHWLRSRPL